MVGTGTDVGKTYVTSLIIKKLHDAGINAAYCKVAMSGNTKTENGKIIPGDAYFVKKISGIRQSLSEMCKYVYEMPASPHLASRHEKNYVDMHVIEESFKKVCEKYDYVTIEGSGGIVCPIRFGSNSTISEDLVKKFSSHIYLPQILYLYQQIISSLTSEYVKQNKMNLKVNIINSFLTGNMIYENDIVVCE